MRGYIIYLCRRDSCEVKFSHMYNSYGEAKCGVEDFLEKWAEKEGKTMKIVSKIELEKIKTLRKPEMLFYVKKKVSESVLYKIVTIPGMIYNSYRIEKFGKVHIEEISSKIIDKNEGKVEVNKKVIFGLPYQDRSPLLDELKAVVSKRVSCFSFVNRVREQDNEFLDALIKKKELLKKLE
jgi:hypothetical protein